MLRAITKFINEESGATAIEYGLITALVSVGGISALTDMGDQLIAMFNTVMTTLTVG